MRATKVIRRSTKKTKASPTEFVGHQISNMGTEVVYLTNTLNDLIEEFNEWGHSSKTSEVKILGKLWRFYWDSRLPQYKKHRDQVVTAALEKKGLSQIATQTSFESRMFMALLPSDFENRRVIYATVFKKALKENNIAAEEFAKENGRNPSETEWKIHNAPTFEMWVNEIGSINKIFRPKEKQATKYQTKKTTDSEVHEDVTKANGLAVSRASKLTSPLIHLSSKELKEVAGKLPRDITKYGDVVVALIGITDSHSKAGRIVYVSNEKELTETLLKSYLQTVKVEEDPALDTVPQVTESIDT